MVITLIIMVVIYIIGFFLGRKYERDVVMDGVYGVLSQVDASNSQVDSITYYYTKASYDAEVKRIKELGEEIIGEDNNE